MIYLCRYGEIHLKGLNRPYFEKLLRQAIRRAVAPFPGVHVRREQGRIFVADVREEDQPAVESALSRVFGLHSISPVREIVKEADLAAVRRAAAEAAVEYLKHVGRPRATFKVEVKRADKRFPGRSMDIAADIGAYVLTHVPEMTVDVHEPDLTIHVEIREKCWLYTSIVRGAGGLPIRSSGRGMLLLSGGIDSPVAGYEIARRGVALDAVHFESFPYTSAAAKDKVVRLARILAGYVGRICLHVVSLTNIQTTIHEQCPAEMMVLLTRRFMIRIAQRLARQNDCRALITGENLGQVASQTIESIAVVDCVADMPIFRPLISWDKLGIIEKAREIGTYETSIEPYEDCCTVFVPKHPMTRPARSQIEEAEKVLRVEELVDQAVHGAARIVVHADQFHMAL